jgi:hypothetical protein
MNLIETMPTYLGQQFYPAGYPLPADKISVNGKTVQEIFFDTCDGDFSEDDPRITIVNNYYRYHLLAPCWDLGNVTEAEIMSADSDMLFKICMDLGIDPL